MLGSNTVIQVPLPEFVFDSATRIITLPDGITVAETGTRLKPVSGVQVRTRLEFRCHDGRILCKF